MHIVDGDYIPHKNGNENLLRTFVMTFQHIIIVIIIQTARIRLRSLFIYFFFL